LVTDKLRSYDAAHRTVMPTVYYKNRGFIKSSGSILSTNSFRIEVQAPEMEVDGLDVSRFIAKATTLQSASISASCR